MPDTIEDRAVIVSMRRRAPGETVKPTAHAATGRRCKNSVIGCTDGCGEHLAALTNAEPELLVEDRPADVGEPLVAIADAAGGDSPAHIRKACVAMTSIRDSDDGSAQERILADLYAVGRRRARPHGDPVRARAGDSSPTASAPRTS